MALAGLAGLVLPSRNPRCNAVARCGHLRADASTVDEDVLRVAVEAGQAAAEVVVARLGADVVKTKASRGDLLTLADSEVQQLIEDRVRSAFPDHAFLGEESVEPGACASAEALEAFEASTAPYLWICDPIDGTTNFVQSLPLVGMCAAGPLPTPSGSA